MTEEQKIKSIHERLEKANDCSWTDLAIATAKEYAGELLAANQEWTYGHGEIEAACGGKTALAVRQKVMARRKSIDLAAIKKDYL